MRAHRPPFSSLPLQPRPALLSPRSILGPLSFQSLTNCPPFATLFETLSFQSITNCLFFKLFVLITIQQYRGVPGCGGSKGLNRNLLRKDFDSPCFHLSLFFSDCCALFCTFLHSRKTQLVSFQAFAHSLPRTPGWGVSFFRRGWRRPTCGDSFLPPVTSHDSRITSHGYWSHCVGRRSVPQWPL